MVILSVLLATLLCGLPAWAQNLEPPFLGDSPIESWYGPRIHPISGIFQFHDGIDYPGEFGKAIYSVEGGVVQRIRRTFGLVA